MCSLLFTSPTKRQVVGVIFRRKNLEFLQAFSSITYKTLNNGISPIK